MDTGVDEIADGIYRVSTWVAQDALTSDDLVAPAMDAEAMFRGSSLAPDTLIVMSRLAELEPATLALTHGSSFSGDDGSALRSLAEAYDAPATCPGSERGRCQALAPGAVSGALTAGA